MIIGITGGTGCGKTTLLREIEKRGGTVMDCDAIYHQLLKTDPELLRNIEENFPGTVENHVLDRKKLGNQVFGNSAALRKLNKITHSAVKEEVLRQLKSAGELAAIDAIALFDSGLAEICDTTVAISAPTEARVARLVKRDGISEAYACKRIAAQKDQNYFVDQCEDTLYNDADKQEFIIKCRNYLDRIFRKYGLEEEIMEKREKNLVILAAGIGSRYKDGVKQLKSVGPAGECIMEYSVYDALRAGFNRIVFIIRRDIEPLFNEMIGDRIRKICEARGVEMVCAYQDMEDLPGDFHCPADRTKPWGTGHALLSCKGLLHSGFAVINADDYYGTDAYQLMSDFLDRVEDGRQGYYGLAGFRLNNTLSAHGGVTRGLCRTDEHNLLTEIQETKNIQKNEQGGFVEQNGAIIQLDGAMPVSMNMWAFTPDILDRLESRFADFLTDGGIENLTSEFLIPIEIGGMILKKEIEVQVIPTSDRWFGMTYAADTEIVRQGFQNLTERKIYPSPLFD